MKVMFRIAMAVAALLMLLQTLPAQAGEMDTQLTTLQQAWDKANFTLKGDAKEKALAGLADKAHAITARFPDRPEPRVWEAIVLSSYAGAKGGLGALKLVRRARDLLQQAQKMDPTVLDGAVYTSLGSLYYQVPGWPIGFGDDDKAATYLKKALALNPNDIDANYFYGDYLIEQHEYKRAIPVLKHALAAPPRPGRTIADAGRRREIAADLSKAKEKMHSGFTWQ